MVLNRTFRSGIFNRFGVSIGSTVTVTSDVSKQSAPKGKVKYELVIECIYHTPCKNCFNAYYVRKTGKGLWVREGVHGRKLEPKDTVRFSGRFDVLQDRKVEK